MSVIVAENLTKHYGPRVGVDSLSLTVPEGMVFGFIGPNGAGKTTTIRLLLGLLYPTLGKAAVLGMDCWRESHTIKAEVGYISGDLRLYSWMTARNALRIVGQIRGRDLSEPGDELIDRFELEPDVRVRNMSRGMRQKLGLILALVHHPKVLIMDEPTSALDPPMQQALYQHLLERAAQGATIFFSSHTLSEVEGLCDRVAIVREGKLVENDTLRNLRERAKREVTLTWNDENTNIELPGILRLKHRRGPQWTCVLEGDSIDVVRWAAQQPLRDMTISPPDLETLFKTYYHEQEPRT